MFQAGGKHITLLNLHGIMQDFIPHFRDTIASLQQNLGVQSQDPLFQHVQAVFQPFVQTANRHRQQ